MSRVHVIVKDREGKIVLDEVGYDPAENENKFPALDLPEGALPASGKPYVLTCDPPDYVEDGQQEWPDGSIRRFEVEEV